MEPSRVAAWAAIVRVLRSPAILLADLLATFFPADCRCCDGPLTRTDGVPLCKNCLRRLVPGTLIACERCGEGMDLSSASGSDFGFEDIRFAGMRQAGLECRECRMVPPDFDRSVSFATYEHEVRTLIQMLKFESVQAAVKPLGDSLAGTILQLRPLTSAKLLVIAVPLFPARERQRGYNQSVLLANRALARLRRSHPDWSLKPAHRLLVRVRRTEAQYVLSRRGRRRNLRGAFAVRGEVTGREILLIDDIMTSGATARECARVLKAAGATKVWVATVARAQKLQVRRQHEDPGEYVAKWDSTAIGVRQSFT